MFERYTEKARRAIFFARYEASQFGSPYIATDHVLLGLLRENKYILVNILRLQDEDTVRREIETRSGKKEKTSTQIDLPLDDESKRVLKYAAEEADRLNHRHIGTEHLLLGLAHEEKSFAAHLLQARGFNPQKFREDLLKPTPAMEGAFSARPTRHYTAHVVSKVGTGNLEDIKLHGEARNGEFVRRAVKKLREVSWHWQKQSWAARDIVIHRKDRALSFDASLAKTSPEEFELVPEGWNKDYCKICQWELFPSKDQTDHSTGYTNGRDWLCTECYEKFITRDDFFSSNYPELT